MSHLFAYLLSHALTVIAVVGSLVMQVRVFGSRRTTQSTFAWLLAIAFMPFVAIPLYLLLGSRKFPRRAKLAGAFGTPRHAPDEGIAPGSPIALLANASGVAPARSGHSFELLGTGEVAFSRLMTLIGEAKASIDLTMFILGDDATGRAVIEALAARAQLGVHVRLVLDAVGCQPTFGRAARALAAVGAEARAFMPLRHSPVRGRTNLRSHRKLGVFDGGNDIRGRNEPRRRVHGRGPP